MIAVRYINGRDMIAVVHIVADYSNIGLQRSAIPPEIAIIVSHAVMKKIHRRRDHEQPIEVRQSSSSPTMGKRGPQPGAAAKAAAAAKKAKASPAAPMAQGSTTKRTPSSAFDPAAGKDTYEPEAIVGERLAKGVTQYQVKWVGWSTKDNTWEPIEHLARCEDMIAEFKEKERTRIAQLERVAEEKHREKEAAAAAAAAKAAEDAAAARVAAKYVWLHRYRYRRARVRLCVPRTAYVLGGESCPRTTGQGSGGSASQRR
jgi:hypothetical protein